MKNNTVRLLCFAPVLFLLAVSPFAKWPWLKAIRLQEIAFGLVFVSGAAWVFARGRLREDSLSLPWPALGLIGAAFMSLANAADIRAGITESLEVSMFMLLFLVVFLAYDRNLHMRMLAAGMTLACAAVVIMAVVQLVRFRSAPWGAFDNRNVLWGFSAGTAVLGAAWLAAARRKSGLVAAGVLFAGLFLVVPNGGWLCLALGLVLLAANPRTRGVAVAAGLGAAMGLALSFILFQQHFGEQMVNLRIMEPDGHDVAQRYLEWHAALNMLKDRVVFGVGAGNYEACIGRYYEFLPKLNTLERDAQSGWLLTGGTMGLAGLCMAAWLFGEAIRRGRRPRDEDAPAWGFRAAAAVWAAANMFTPVLVRETGPYVVVVLAVLWADAARTKSAGPASGCAGRPLPAWCARGLVALGLGAALAMGLQQPIEQRVCLTIEAETMKNVVPPMQISSDPLASGMKVLEIPLGAGQGFWKQAGGSAEADIDVPRKDTYTVWLRAKWGGSCENAVYLGIDDDEPVVAGNDAIFKVYHWVRTVPFALEPGIHKIRLRNHSHGVMIDKIEVVNDPRYEPLGHGHEVSVFFDGFGGCDGQDWGSWTREMGRWTIIGDSVANIRATSATLAQTDEGTGLAYAHQIRWANCDIQAYMMSAGAGVMGLVFSYVDKGRYLLVEWANARVDPAASVKAFSVSGSKRTLLGEGGKGYRNDTWHVLGVRRESGRVRVSTDGREVLVVEGVHPAVGHVGLYTRGNACTYFDNVRVTALEDGRPVQTPDETGADPQDKAEEIIDGRPFIVERARVGDRRIPAWLVYEAGRAGSFGPALIELHAWGESKSLKARRLAPRPAQRGYVEVHPDLRAHGERREDGFELRCHDNFPRAAMYVLRESAKDMRDIVDYLEQRKDIGVTRIGIAGYSMGGSVALMALTLDRRIDAAASICGTGCDLLNGATNTAYAGLRGWNTDIRRQIDSSLRADYAEYDPFLHLDRFLNRPVLFLGNPNDRIADPACIVKLFASLKAAYGDCADRLTLIWSGAPIPNPENDPMLSHMPDPEQLPRVDTFLDAWLLEKSPTPPDRIDDGSR